VLEALVGELLNAPEVELPLFANCPAPTSRDWLPGRTLSERALQMCTVRYLTYLIQMVNLALDMFTELPSTVNSLGNNEGRIC
jgi:hypothetical protein